MLAIFKKPLQKSSCFDTCNEVSMAAFIDAIIDNNLSGLIKSGTPTLDELNAAWEKVFNEYLKISGDTHVSTLLELLKSIAVLSNKLRLIEIIVNELLNYHDNELATHLQSLGFRFQYKNGPELKHELEITIVQAKALLLQVKQDQAELEELRQSEGSAATRQDYELQFSAIEEFKSVAIDPNTYTVSRYCADIKRMKERYKPQAA